MHKYTIACILRTAIVDDSALCTILMISIWLQYFHTALRWCRWDAIHVNAVWNNSWYDKQIYKAKINRACQADKRSNIYVMIYCFIGGIKRNPVFVEFILMCVMLITAIHITWLTVFYATCRILTILVWRLWWCWYLLCWYYGCRLLCWYCGRQLLYWSHWSLWR